MYEWAFGDQRNPRNYNMLLSSALSLRKQQHSYEKLAITMSKHTGLWAIVCVTQWYSGMLTIIVIDDYKGDCLREIENI